MISVTQQDTPPLQIGAKVLVIAGAQARIVPDYTVVMDPAPPAADTQKTDPPPAPVAQAPLAAPPAPVTDAQPVAPVSGLP